MKTKDYLKIQLKRIFRLYPSVLLVTLSLIIAIATGGYFVLKNNMSSEDKQKMIIGVTGDLSDTYLEIGIYALKNMDSSRFAIDFVTMDEEVAENKLRSHEIVGFIRVPDDFVKEVSQMKYCPLTYVTEKTPSGFGSVLVEELTVIVSEYISQSQRGIFAMKDFARANGLTKSLWDETQMMNVEYVETILKRADSYEHKVLGISDKLTLGGYYICGGIVFFLLLWGISCNSFLMKKDYSLEKILVSRGQSSFAAVLSENVAYITVTFCTLLLIFTVTGIFLQDIHTGILELDRSMVSAYFMFAVKILPVIVMVCAFGKMIYELITDMVGVLLFQFLFALITGYVCGCFYPDYFFPETLQKVGAILPTGVMFSYLKQCMSESVSWDVWLLVIGYTALFVAASVMTRKRRLAGDR